jgi:hypothetical protein
MKKAIIAGIFAATAIVFAACSGGTGTEKAKDSASSTMMGTDSTGKMMAAVKYTCKMHPEVISDTPGKCPKCGMALVKMDNSSMKKMPMDSTKH